MGSVGAKANNTSGSYTQAELNQALEDWQSMYYTEIREIDKDENSMWEEWKREMPDEADQIEKDHRVLTQYLKDAPKYQGEVERGLVFESKQALDKFLKENKVGNIVTSKTMASWSSRAGEGRSFAGDQALDVQTFGGYGAIVVMHKVTSNGVAIEVNGQQEKILPKGIKNKVLKVTKSKYTNHGKTVPQVDIYYKEIK